MTLKQKMAGRTSSMPAGLLLGGAASFAVTVICAAVIAKLVDTEVMEEQMIGYGIIVLLILSSFVGAMISSGKTKRKRLVTCLASGVVYFGILMAITTLFFGGQYSAVGVTALLVFCGSVLAVLLNVPWREKKRRIRIAHR